MLLKRPARSPSGRDHTIRPLIRTEVTSGMVDSSGLLPGGGLLQDPHDVALFHDQILDPVELDLRAGPFAEQHAVPGLEIDRAELARLVAAAGADADDFTLLRLLLGGIGNDDATGGLFLGLDALDDDAIVKRAELHGFLHLQIELSQSPAGDPLR